MKISIIVAAHKPFTLKLDNSYLALQVGAAGRERLGLVTDDTGKNISGKNPSFCELTGLYWAWKNLTDADIIGLVHYRRFFKGKHGLIATGDEIAEKLGKYDCILPKKRNYFIETAYSHYAHAHNIVDLETTRAIIAEKHPAYLAAFDKAMKSTRGHRFNMMVMKRQLIDDYCTWLFDILFELEKRLDVSTYSTYDLRVFGFVAERILDVYIETKKIKYAELPVLNLESQHWPTKIMRFLKRKFTARR
jgi:hypothetical protein